MDGTTLDVLCATFNVGPGDLLEYVPEKKGRRVGPQEIRHAQADPTWARRGVKAQARLSGPIPALVALATVGPLRTDRGLPAPKGRLKHGAPRLSPVI